MTITVVEHLPYPPEQIWAVVGDPARVDWVPGVESATYDGDVRRFVMSGAGQLAERIVERDEQAMRLRYQVVESTPPLEAHEACIELAADAQGCRFTWTTDVAPAAVEPFIRQGMEGSLAGLRQVLERE